MSEPHREQAPPPDPEQRAEERPRRRDLLSRVSTIAMAGGLIAGYGGLAAMAGRYVYPARPRQTRWLFVARLADLGPGESLVYRTPLGEKVTIARSGEGADERSILALSSTCPHLGCQVHWQPQNARFFCPCHNGVFTPSGEPVSGPPAEAGTPLPRYPLRVEEGLIYLEAPTEGLAQGEVIEGPERLVGPRRDAVARVDGPGHDPCLAPDARPREA